MEAGNLKELRVMEKQQYKILGFLEEMQKEVSGADKVWKMGRSWDVNDIFTLGQQEVTRGLLTRGRACPGWCFKFDLLCFLNAVIYDWHYYSGKKHFKIFNL